MKFRHWIRATAWAGVFLVSCSEETPNNPPIPNIPAPFDLTAVVGPTRVTVGWQSDATVSYDEFRVYRSDDGATTFSKVGSVAASPYQDTTVRTGTVYVYQVAGVQEGIEGKRSTNLIAGASAFTVSVNGGAPFTNSRDVQLFFSAPGGTQLMRFGNSSDLSGQPWVASAGSAATTLTAGDGVKTVYAAFTDEFGHESDPVADTITLDTVAGIASGALTPTANVAPGSILHFTVSAAGAETDGLVSIDVESFGTPIEARDDGTLGDPTADDGVYERDFTSPISFRGKDLGVRATFADAAGNRSDEFEFGQRLSFTDPPSPVTWLPVENIETTSMRLRWTQSADLNFGTYEIYREVTSGVSRDTSSLLTQIGSAAETSYDDAGLDEAQNYYYVIYVVNDLDDAAASTELLQKTADEPPTAVVLDSVSSVGPNTLTLTWSRNNNTDFAEYRVYREVNSPGVTVASELVLGGTITDRFQTFFDDTNVTTGSNTYYYRVFVVDNGGNTTRSNEVSSKP